MIVNMDKVIYSNLIYLFNLEKNHDTSQKKRG
jgi:hypothetical protein